MSMIGAAGRWIDFEELSLDDFRCETAETWPRPVVDVLLAFIRPRPGVEKGMG
jgi:hypothetical protein